jgi:hypothetical protein
MNSPTVPDTTEQRKKRRVVISDRVDVSDAHSGNIMGQLVNLSIDGFMLVGSGCIKPGTLYQLKIPLDAESQPQLLLVGAECLWCHDANESGAYWSGFHIIDISPEHRQALAGVVT